MEKAIKDFIQNQNHFTGVELLVHLKLTIATIDLNEAIGESIARRDVAKLLNIIPAQGLAIDIGATRENDITHHMQAITTEFGRVGPGGDGKKAANWLCCSNRKSTRIASQEWHKSLPIYFWLLNDAIVRLNILNWKTWTRTSG